MSIAPLVAQYLTCLQTEGKTPATIRWHRQSLRQFTGWLDQVNGPHDPEQWNVPLLRSYIAYHQTRTKANGAPVSAAQVNSLVRSLRAFCTWLREDGWVERDLFQRVTVPRVPYLVKDTFSPEDITRLLAAARNRQRNALRDEAVILFLLDTGCRANEVCTLRLLAVDWTRHVATVWGKGRKERVVPFSPTTAKAMQKYLLRSRQGKSECFFESEEGRPLTPSGLYQLCSRLARSTGVAVNPHKFRHTFAITCLRNGASVFAVQKMLGHSTLDVTLRYAALVTDDIIAAHQQHGPVASFIRTRRS